MNGFKFSERGEKIKYEEEEDGEGEVSYLRSNRSRAWDRGWCVTGGWGSAPDNPETVQKAGWTQGRG